MVRSLEKDPILGLLTTMYITIRLNANTQPGRVQCTVITLFKSEELLSGIGSLLDS